MSDMNACSFTGRVGQDPELKYTQGGMAVLSISFAVGGKRKTGGKWEDTTTWLRTSVFDKRAEALSKLISKGSRIGVVGQLQVREWEGKDGKTGKSVEVFAQDIVLLDGKRDGGARTRDEQPADAGQSGDVFDDDQIPF